MAFSQALSREEGYAAPALQARHVRVEGFGPGARFRTLIAEQDGRPVGYALFYPAYDTDHAARGLYLQDLYVVAEARRQGAGRALMAAVARACQDDGGCYVFWNALPNNRAGLAFYHDYRRPRGARAHAQPAAGCAEAAGGGEWADGRVRAKPARPASAR